MAENTLIFFLGDNGSDAPLGHQHAVACAAPLRGKKGAHYEGGMRVPFIAAWAKTNETNLHQKKLPIPAGAIQTQLAAVQDLFPTIIDLAGAETPENHVVDGLRLETLLTGRRDDSRAEEFLMHYPHSPHRSDYFTCYRSGDWKVIYHYFPSEVSEGSHYQLYNLADDPFESTNLAGSKPDKLRSMMEKLTTSLDKHEMRYHRRRKRRPNATKAESCRDRPTNDSNPAKQPSTCAAVIYRLSHPVSAAGFAPSFRSIFAS